MAFTFLSIIFTMKNDVLLTCIFAIMTSGLLGRFFTMPIFTMNKTMAVGAVLLGVASLFFTFTNMSMDSEVTV